MGFILATTTQHQHQCTLDSAVFERAVTSEKRKTLMLHRTSLMEDQDDTSPTRHGGCIMTCSWNARKGSSNANLHAPLVAARHVRFHAIILLESKARRDTVIYSRFINDMIEHYVYHVIWGISWLFAVLVLIVLFTDVHYLCLCRPRFVSCLPFGS